jgi:hypothetical protein
MLLTSDRSRHVKCDETKPFCNRCTRARRRCEGYAEPIKPRRSDQLKIVQYVAPNSRSVSPYPETDPREIRALEYFKLVTASELAGEFSADLWTKHILRIAYYQPSIHHALVALGSAHEEFAKSPRFDFPEYASRQYGKAIRDVINLDVASSSAGVETALVTCALFSSLESLRGHYLSSVSHLTSGLNVLEEEQRQQRSIDQLCIPRELLLSLFLRLDSQRMEIGGVGNIQGSMLSMMARPSIPERFTSLSNAWSTFDLINYQFLQLQYRAESASRDYIHFSDYWPGLVAQQGALRDLWQEWEAAYNRMLQHDGVQERSSGIILLEMASRTLQLMLNVHMLDPENDWDQYTDLFSRIVDNAEEFVDKDRNNRDLEAHPSTSNQPSRQSSTSQQPPKPPSAPAFTLSLGCINILYLTATRCRNFSIRHRALNLLKRCNRREGLWDSNLSAKVAESLITIEETKTLEGLKQLKLEGAEDLQLSLADSIVIPSQNRVRSVDLKFGPEAKGKVMYSFDLVMRNDEGELLSSDGVWQLLEW